MTTESSPVRGNHVHIPFKQKRKTRSKNLNDRYSIAKVKKLVFTDEKDFSYTKWPEIGKMIGCLVRAKMKFLVPDFITKLVDLPKRLWCRRGIVEW